MTIPLDMEAFRDLLETYGANLDRWPTGSVEQIQLLLQSSEDAVSLLESYAKVDALFQETGDKTPPDGLLERIMKNAK